MDLSYLKKVLISHLKESHSVINEEALKILANSAVHLNKTADEIAESTMISAKYKPETNG